MPRKLIEVALPLDAINQQSAREKSIRKGHPSTLHLWWSRKPTATSRAVLFSQLVDDPSERYEEFLEAARAEGEADPESAAERAVGGGGRPPVTPHPPPGGRGHIGGDPPQAGGLGGCGRP